MTACSVRLHWLLMLVEFDEDFFMAEKAHNLEGRTALVTGGGVRLGKEICLGLARCGADVVVHYHTSEAEAEEVVGLIEQMGRRAWSVGVDMLEPGGPETVFAAALVQAGDVDILVNNASVWDADTIWEVSEESLVRNMRMHVLGPLVLARSMARRTEKGHVVNLLDTRVTTVDKQHASYHLSKRGLLTLTRMLAVELAPGITVNGVAPGLVLPPAGEDEAYLEKLAHSNPMHRYGGPGDVVEAVLYLVQSRFITGQVIYVDGGAHMKGHTYD